MQHRKNIVAALTSAGRFLLGFAAFGILTYAGICSVYIILMMLWELAIFLRGLW